MSIPKKCICGCNVLVIDEDELRCDECNYIVAIGVKLQDGKIMATKDFEDWTLV